jgi:hypothetical protein
MWIVYDEYDRDAEQHEFYSVQDAGDWVEASDDPLTWRIQYID